MHFLLSQQLNDKNILDAFLLFKKIPIVTVKEGFTGGSDGTESTCIAGYLGLITGLGRFPGGGHGNLLQYSCLENPHGQRSLADYTVHGIEKSQI